MKKGFFAKKILAFTLCIGSVFATPACALLNKQSKENMDHLLTVPEFTNPVSLVHDEVAAYLNASPDALVSDYLPEGTYRYDRGVEFALPYTFDAVAEQDKPFTVKLQISQTEDFSVIEQTFVSRTDVRKISLSRLHTGVHYYFRLEILKNEEAVATKCGEFTTAQSPRFINLDGANNVRDIGGWETESGKRIKQGLLYRGSEIDGGKNSGHEDFCLTEKGIRQLQALGIKSDIDLRSEDDKASTHSILGENVQRTFYNFQQYQSIITKGTAQVKALFSTLAKPETYPAYMHCTHGVDRAGSASLLLEALLGVPKENLVRDYELSAFYHNYKHVNRNFENGGNVLALLAALERFSGETLSEKTAIFLLSTGVTQAEIDSIKKIFLA